MKKLIFSLFGIFILLALPLQAIEMDMSVLNDLSEDISKDLHVPTIVGPDEREEITGKASESEQAAVVIVIAHKSGHTNSCSGVMLGPRIVLTAAHCINKEGKYPIGAQVFAVGVSESEILYEKKKIDVKSWVYDEESNNRIVFFASAKKFWVPNEYIQYESEENDNYQQYDYGFIVVDYDFGNITNWLELKVMSDEQLYDTDIIVLGRGKDKLSLSLWKSPGHIEKVSGNIIYHDADTLKGNSGSPIFKANDPQNVIAISNWGSEDGNPLNRGLRIRQEIVDNINKINKGELEMYHLPNND